MYIVNTTFVVEPEAQDQWLDIINSRYIPFLKENGYNVLALSRVISVEAVSHFTYSLLVEVPGLEEYRRLSGELFEEYVRIADPLFGTKVMWLTTLMKKLE